MLLLHRCIIHLFGEVQAINLFLLLFNLVSRWNWCFCYIIDFWIWFSFSYHMLKLLLQRLIIQLFPHQVHEISLTTPKSKYRQEGNNISFLSEDKRQRPRHIRYAITSKMALSKLALITSNPCERIMQEIERIVSIQQQT